MPLSIPQPVFSARGTIRGPIARMLQSASHIDLFLDYDGTLAPIRRRPSEAVISRNTARLLNSLARLPDIRVAIVTGRSMKDIRSILPIPNIGYAANHGLQILEGGHEWCHPDIGAYIRILTKVSGMLRKALKQFPRVFVENKRLTVSVHYRNVQKNQMAGVRALVLAMVRNADPSLIITRGKMVLEIRPPVKWNKGDAILQLLGARRSDTRSLAVFAGDDTTDEDAFRVLKRKGITIRVRKGHPTMAQYYLENGSDVGRFLRELLMIRRRTENSVTPRSGKSRGVIRRSQIKEYNGGLPCEQ